MTIYERTSAVKQDFVTLTESAACFRFIKETNETLSLIHTQLKQGYTLPNAPTVAVTLFESYINDLETLYTAVEFAYQEYSESYENTKHFLKNKLEHILLDKELSEAIFGQPLNLGEEDILAISKVYPETFHKRNFVFHDDFCNIDIFTNSFHSFLQGYRTDGEKYLQTVVNENQEESEHHTFDKELLPSLILSCNPYYPEPIERVLGKLVTLHILLDHVREQTVHCMNLVDDALDYEQTEAFLQSIGNPDYRAGYAYPINPFDEMSLKTYDLNEKLQQAFSNGLAYYVGAHKAEILELCDGMDEIQLRSMLLQFSPDILEHSIDIERIQKDTPENCFNSFRVVLLDYFADKIEE